MKTKNEDKKCACRKQMIIGMANVKNVDGICHRVNKPCYVVPQVDKNQCNCQYESGHGQTCPLYIPAPNPMDKNQSKECKHEPTGEWRVTQGKSYAGCKKCGEYETDLEKGNFPQSNTMEWEKKYWEKFNNRIGACFECCEAEKLLDDIRDFISQVEQEKRIQIEHCSEPECPACNLVAYNKGKSDVLQSLKEKIEILKENTQAETGAYKYDFVYEEVIVLLEVE